MAVKSKKNFFDAIDFDEIGDSMDLWWNTIHDSYQFDAISKKKEFNAVVISPPVPIGANSNEMDTFMDGVSGNFTDTLPKFVFRARLKDVASHHVFWPDPCDPRFVEDAGGQENAIDWISKHMKVVAINATEVPKVGDTVRVKLNKQGIYTANAETAIMVGLVTSLDSIDPLHWLLWIQQNVEVVLVKYLMDTLHHQNLCHCRLGSLPMVQILCKSCEIVDTLAILVNLLMRFWLDLPRMHSKSLDLKSQIPVTQFLTLKNYIRMENWMEA
jgi:hypothetical protein